MGRATISPKMLTLPSLDMLLTKVIMEWDIADSMEKLMDFDL